MESGASKSCTALICRCQTLRPGLHFARHECRRIRHRQHAQRPDARGNRYADYELTAVSFVLSSLFDVVVVGYVEKSGIPRFGYRAQHESVADVRGCSVWLCRQAKMRPASHEYKGVPVL